MLLFLWDEENIQHISRHNVEPFEAEDALMDPQRIKFSAHSGNMGIIGSTEDGRRLVVIYIKKVLGKIRVITARDATESEARTYKRRNR
ncbi:BrnT family toxin [Paenibacillus sp. GCM10028914]|uniref:BrnT family toxin n=1 Tax=Paenibacillus sp. GCM10028914 TaxID=3273416 RepID=UPI00361F523A